MLAYHEVMDFDSEQEAAATFVFADLFLSPAEYCRVNKLPIVIDDSMEDGVIFLRETKWEAPHNPKAVHRLQYMSSSTFEAPKSSELLRAIRDMDLVEVDAPFGPAPLPPATWLGDSHVAKIMLGQDEHPDPRFRNNSDDVRISYSAGVVNLHG